MHAAPKWAAIPSSEPVHKGDGAQQAALLCTEGPRCISSSESVYEWRRRPRSPTQYLHCTDTFLDFLCNYLAPPLLPRPFCIATSRPRPPVPAPATAGALVAPARYSQRGASASARQPRPRPPRTAPAALSDPFAFPLPPSLPPRAL